MKAASKKDLGGVHARLARVFTKVLDRYDMRLDALETLKRDPEKMDSLSSEVLDELLGEGAMPSPAMLAAIANFLKQNEIFAQEDEDIHAMSALQRRLADKESKRKNVVDLRSVATS